jgi:hypothetical protein
MEDIEGLIDLIKFYNVTLEKGDMIIWQRPILLLHF